MRIVTLKSYAPENATEAQAYTSVVLYLSLKIALNREEEIRVAYDEVDGAIKFKVGNGVWSPPLFPEQVSER